MTVITCRDDLARARAGDRAIVVLHAEWSFQSKRNFEIVEAWDRLRAEREGGPDFEVFMVVTDGAYPDFVAEWLQGEPRLKGYLATGWGEVIWLSRGRVADVQWNGITGQRLTERTIASWG